MDAGTFSIHVGASSRDIRLIADVEINSEKKRYHKLKEDCGFHEMFESQEGRKSFLEFLVEHEMVTKEQANEELISKLEKTFWPVRVFMDMNSGGIITYKMIDQLINKINKMLE